VEDTIFHKFGANLGRSCLFAYFRRS
jgi:hypothetical protein